jgi:hypothetical protein
MAAALINPELTEIFSTWLENGSLLIVTAIESVIFGITA